MALSRPPQAGAGAIGEDFPIVCEPCLGGNPYVRMLKGTMGKECRISGRPFNSFRWQGAHNKWKETVIAPEVAREKNCCMSCLNDLEYGVPFHVRDQLLEALGTDMAPESAVNKEFWWANKRQKQEDEGAASGLDTYATLRDNVDKLRAFAALEPGPIVRPRRETPLTPEEQERLRQRRLMEQKPPEDTSITSLYVGSVPPSVTKRDLMPYMMAYGAALPLPLPLTLSPTPTLTRTRTFSAAPRRAARSGGRREQALCVRNLPAEERRGEGVQGAPRQPDRQEHAATGHVGAPRQGARHPRHPGGRGGGHRRRLRTDAAAAAHGGCCWRQAGVPAATRSAATAGGQAVRLDDPRRLGGESFGARLSGAWIVDVQHTSGPSAHGIVFN